MTYESPITAVQIPTSGYTVFGDHSNSDKPALISAATGETITFKQLVESINRLSDALFGLLGFEKRDVVAIFSPNHMQYATVLHAVVKCGGTVSPANPLSTVSEFTFQLKDSQTRFIFAHPATIDVVHEAALNAGIPQKNIILFDEASFSTTASGYKTISQICDENSSPAPIVELTEQEISENAAFLCYSSGTTGLPKAVHTTQLNIIANIHQHAAMQKHTGEVTSEDILTAVVPLFHIYGLSTALHMFLQHGCTVVLFPKFELELFLKSLQKYGVTYAYIVPPILLLLAKSPIVEGYLFPKLRGFLSGAAPLSADLSDAVFKRLGIVVSQGFGMTEASPVSHMLPYSMARQHPGSVGFLFPNIQARLVDPETGIDVPKGDHGELWVRGPNIMKGYHNDPEATRQAIDEGGWYHTGDVLTVSDEGLFYVVDRIKELIKYKGFQVAPAELEAYLLQHPAVSDCAVIGRPDETAGELPRAFVVLKPGAECTESQVQEFVAAKVSPHKRLRGGVEFVAAIPKSASGKILRRVLRAQDAQTVAAA